MTQIKSFGILQTAKFMAVMYFISTAVFAIPAGIIISLVGASSSQGNPILGSLSGFGMLLIPVAYGAMGFVVVAIGCLFYNLVAKFVGGIEIEIQTEEENF